ncbi:MAG: ComF family protein [Patescibacteria group bacterium]|nr:ComF family protein [Patescibacteria group bacterium]
MYKSLIKPLFHDIKNFALDILFPINCITCGKEGFFVCDYCKAQLAPQDTQHCIACQKPSPFGLTHAGCQTPYGADALVSFFSYHDDKVAKIIIHGKYYFLPQVYQIFGKLIAEKCLFQYHQFLLPNGNNLRPILIPVPLARSRKRWRGFNQAEVLCQTLNETLELPYCTNLLARRRATKTQKDLKKEQRIKNVAGAFIYTRKNRCHGEEIVSVQGRHVILVDDVATTGSTLQEAAKVLKRNGATKVFCLTVARD